MRQSTCGDIRTSVLGFGCGSVLGRVGRGASLRAMNAAWDQGITLFDTARSYGYGEAEAVLGEFLRGKREQAIVATKFGITPQPQSLLKRIAVPVARAALQTPGVRRLRGGGAHETAYGQFTVAGLRASLETSLRQLQTDYVDLLFLHEATSGAAHQQDLMAELDSLISAGKVRRAGLYAGANVIAECLADGPQTLGVMQFGADPFDPVVAGITEHPPAGALLIGNHPFGGAQRVARVQRTLSAMTADETVSIELRDKLRSVGWQELLEAILALTLNGMSTHALVFSMMREDHLRANARAVESDRFSAADLQLMRERLLQSSA